MSPFERIEESRIRPVGMVVSPYAEGAPGDTLMIDAYFAGKPVAEVRDMRICIGEFDTVGTPAITTMIASALPDSCRFSYSIPDTMLDSLWATIRSSDAYTPELEILVAALRANTLAGLENLDSSTLAAAVTFLTGFNLLCRCMFTVAANDGETLKVRKDFMVRYHSRLKNIPAIASRLPINRNPGLRFVALYKVKGERSTFDPADSAVQYSMSFLQTVIPHTPANDTIEIDTGYSYFLGTDTGIVSYEGDGGETISDTTIDHYPITRPVSSGSSELKDTLIREYYSYRWFYESRGGSSQEYDKRMALQQYETKPVIKLFPPVDLGVKGCRIWVKIVDYIESNAPRPTGLSRTCVTGVFRYTDAYKKSVERL